MFLSLVIYFNNLGPTAFKNLLKQMLHFLWSYYQLEDLACMSSCGFDSNNGSPFSMEKLCIYSLLKIHSLFYMSHSI